MENRDLAKILLKTIGVFYFLQHVDEQIEHDDKEMKRIVRTYFARHWPNAPAGEPERLFQPFIQLYTTLPILTTTACFASQVTQDEWNSVGFSLQPEYGIRVRDASGANQDPTEVGVFRIVRNALAHLPDFASANAEGCPNVMFGDGIVVKFSSRKSGSVEFADALGFVQFLSDYLKALRELIFIKLIPDGRA